MKGTLLRLTRTFLTYGFKILTLLLAVSIIAFILVSVSPIDPVQQYIVGLGTAVSPEQRALIEEYWGVNEPPVQRYLTWLSAVLHGDLGLSFRSRTPVMDELLVRFKVTFNISAWSIILGILLGIFFGIVSALKQNTIWDTLSTGCALFGISMPMFWQGLMLILVFSVWLGWLPPSGYGSSWKQMVLPVIALGVNSSATIMRTTRSSMLEVMRQDYIRTAKAKGQTYWAVVVRHALRNAMIPIVTVIGLQLGVLLAGSIVTESIFSIAGVGKYLVDSMNARDYNAVQGCVLLIAFVSAILNLIVDIIYTFIDPRMKTMYQSSKSSVFQIRKKGEKKAA